MEVKEAWSTNLFVGGYTLSLLFTYDISKSLIVELFDLAGHL